MEKHKSKEIGQYFGIVIDDPGNTLQFTLRRRHSSVCKFKPRFDENDFHLRDKAAKYGLRMHLGKTKILSNVPPESDQSP